MRKFHELKKKFQLFQLFYFWILTFQLSQLFESLENSGNSANKTFSRNKIQILRWQPLVNHQNKLILF